MLKIYLERFRQNRLAVAGFVVIVSLAVLAIAAPWLCPQDPLAQRLLERLQGPSRFHWLGTDDLGRDVFSRLLVGTRISLSVGFVAVGIECLSIREREYIQAAQIAGISTPRILFIHLLPNVVAPILVSATLGVAGAILTESALSFLGLGVQPPTPSWGNILGIGRDYLHIAWWLSVFPTLAILLTVLAFNLLGEGLRDVLDPRT